MNAKPKPPVPRSRRIAFLLPDMGGGGAERVALTLIKHFIAEGHSVDLVLARAEGELLAAVPPQVRVIDLKARRFRHALRGLCRYLRGEEPDALQVSMWPLTIIGILAQGCAPSNTRLVISEHTTLSQHYERLATRTLIRLTTALTYRLADGRVAVSQGVADDLARLSGISSSEFCIVPNPVDLPPSIMTSPQAEALWAGAKVKILTVGRLTSEKNHALLIEAFARLPENSDAKLIIVGEGPLEDALRQRASACGVENAVIFAGFAVDPWPFYASANLFVLSSNYEGYPVALVEAMHAGLPVVSTDCVSGPRDILKGGQFGRLVQVGDAAALASAIAEALLEEPKPSVVQDRARYLERDTRRRYAELLLECS